MPTLKTYDGHTLELDQEEAEALTTIIAQGKQKVVMIAGNLINISNISGVWNQECDEEQSHSIGVLHDGTRVVRQFGEWFCQDGLRDEKGRYEVRPDPKHYPEVAMDTVPSVKVFETKLLSLPAPERLKLMIEGYEPRRYSGKVEPTKIGE